jgi:hypothetical protein
MSTKIRAALMIAAALSALVTTSSGVAEERRAAKPEQSKKSSLQQQQEEVSDRATDRVALDAQNEAIKRMEVLVKKRPISKDPPCFSDLLMPKQQKKRLKQSYALTRIR